MVGVVFVVLSIVIIVEVEFMVKPVVLGFFTLPIL